MDRLVSGTLPASASTLVAPRLGRTVRTNAYDRVFYTGMSALCLVIVFAGFAPSFYLRPATAPALSTLRIVHGVVFTAWMVLFVVQTSLVAAGRKQLHRNLGIAGVVLAAGMVVLGVAMALQAVIDNPILPGRDPRSFAAVPLFDILFFVPLIALGLRYRRVPETHKRLFLIATISMVGAAAGRFPLTRVYGLVFPYAIVDALLLTGVVFDLATRRRIHPVYVFGSTLMALSHPFRIWVGGTAWWIDMISQVTGK